MASLNNIIIPEIFNPHVQLITQEKSRLIRSRAVTLDPLLDNFLAGSGMTVNIPSFRDLGNEALNIATANTTTSTPLAIITTDETQLRLSRNQSWRSYDLEGALVGTDPMMNIASRVGSYWARMHQRAFIATMKGVFADNDAAPAASEHVRYDLVRNLAFTTDGANTAIAYNASTTTFSASAFIEAALTMGDSLDQISMIMVHSIVYGRMLKNDLITFVKPSDGSMDIPTFMGREVIVDDSMPSPAAGVYESWLFADGAVRLGFGTPKVPTETFRRPDAGTGAGVDELYNRVEWAIAPVGCSWVGSTAPGGGVDDTALAAATAWRRAYPERKQIPFARLVTREA